MTKPALGAFRLREPEPVILICPKHGEFYRGECLPIKRPVLCPQCNPKQPSSRRSPCHQVELL